MIVSPAVCDLRHGLNGIQLIVVMVPLLWLWVLFSHLASAMALDVAKALPLALEIR
jgi:hypothetical protein